MKHAGLCCAVVLLCSLSFGCGGQQSGQTECPTAGPTEVTTTQLEPGGASCVAVGENEAGPIFHCTANSASSVAQGVTCSQLQLIPAVTRQGRGCVANCAAACDLNGADLVAADAALDQFCDQQCAQNGACPSGTSCRMNTVVNRQTVKNCFQPSNFCTNAANPANCSALTRTGECTCHCI